MCLWLAVSTSGFYHWATRPQSATAARRQALIARIQHSFEESDVTYGYRRIHADLAEEQTECSPELVRQLMRQIGLVACQPRPFRITTKADAEAAATMPDLVKRDFTATRLASSSSATSPTSIPGRDSSTWPPSSTAIRRRSSAGPSPITCTGTRRRRPHQRRGDDADRARRDLALRPRQCLYVGRVSGPSDQSGHALLDGPHRCVLGQQHGREFFLDAQERARLPHRIRDEITSSQRRHPVHRRVLQQPTPALRAGLSPA